MDEMAGRRPRRTTCLAECELIGGRIELFLTADSDGLHRRVVRWDSFREVLEE
jgi:hypothetical protein